MHAHSGRVMLAEPQHEPKVRQGITTELIGVDGPLRHAPPARLRTISTAAADTAVTRLVQLPLIIGGPAVS